MPDILLVGIVSRKGKRDYYMEYWIILITTFVVFVACLIVIWKKRIKDDDMENNDFIVLIIIAAVALVFTVILSIDIPSALSGGKEIYVNELPRTYGYRVHSFYTVTDNEELRHLKGVNWNRYERNGNYRIRYTKFTKFVLSVEKID